MNSIEFKSKTLLFYSKRRNNERIDLSSLSDEDFDKIVSGLETTHMCVEGSAFTGEFLMNQSNAAPFISMMVSEIASVNPRVKKLIAYLNALQDGDVFRIVSDDAPTMNKQLAILKMKGEEKGIDDQVIHEQYIVQWGQLATSYRYYAFGYDGIRTVIGEENRAKRVCRFCGGMEPEVKYKDVAHAISEGLGNKLLICNEECDDCNNKLSKLEGNLMHYLDVRRAMGGVLTKNAGKVPSVDGEGFVIRGDDNNNAVLYIEKEKLPKGLDLSQPFSIQLKTNEIVTHQGIYKSLCKIVVDLSPSSELIHMKETIKWINGSVLDDELPSYLAAYNQESVLQPTVDLFFSKKPGIEPYCTAIVHIMDAIFIYIIPEVDVDKGIFKTKQSIEAHLKKFTKPYGDIFSFEDSSEYQLANPWSILKVNPADCRIEIKEQDDPVFVKYKKESEDREEICFPPFQPIGFLPVTITSVVFNRHYLNPVAMADLKQVSINGKKMVCVLDIASETARFEFDLNFSNSSNTTSFFDFSFEAEVKITDYMKYIHTDEFFSLDYHLRDYLFKTVVEYAEVELKKKTIGTDLAPITLVKIINPRIVRQLYYVIILGDGTYFIVKDAELHN